MRLDHMYTFVSHCSLVSSHSPEHLLPHKSPSYLHVSCHVFFFSNDLLNLIRATCMSLGVGLFPGVWATYQWPHHCKKKKKWLTLPQQPLTGSGSLKPRPIHARTERSLVLCRWPQLLCVCKCKDGTSQPSSPPLTLTFLVMFPELGRSDTYVLVRSEHSTVTHFQRFGQLWALAWTNVHCKNKLP